MPITQMPNGTQCSSASSFGWRGQSGKRITAKCQMTPLSNWNYVATGRVDWQQSLCDVSAVMQLCENNLRDGDELTRNIRSRPYGCGGGRVQGRGRGLVQHRGRGR